VERSRQKDDERGARIIDGYASAHPPAVCDEIVQHTWREARRLQDEVNSLLEELKPAAAEYLAGRARGSEARD
jgi:hypothetical protein